MLRKIGRSYNVKVGSGKLRHFLIRSSLNFTTMNYEKDPGILVNGIATVERGNVSPLQRLSKLSLVVSIPVSDRRRALLYKWSVHSSSLRSPV